MNSPVSCLSSMATRGLLADLAALHQGSTVVLTAVGGVEAARRVRDGERTDVVVLASAVMERLASEGHLLPGSVRPVAVCGIAAAVRAGAPAPEIGTAEALQRAVLAADGIGYSTGPSGDHLLRLLDDWGIADQVVPRLHKAPPGVPVARLLEAGTVTLGFQQLSELRGEAGIAVVGLLPGPAQQLTTFSAGIARAAMEPDGARALIATFASGETADVKRRHGMEPG